EALAVPTEAPGQHIQALEAQVLTMGSIPIRTAAEAKDQTHMENRSSGFIP
ncbi:unnamed protein product, partial [Allacma fusca]